MQPETTSAINTGGALHEPNPALTRGASGPHSQLASQGGTIAM
jgi:hypothetical protein